MAGAGRLMLCALEESELEATQTAIRSIRKDIEIFCRAIDVRDSSAVRQFVNDAAEWTGGKIDILCCNAGVSPPIVPIAEGDPDRWWTGFEVNVRGPYLFSRYVLPIMQRQQGGHIIITASRAATVAHEKQSSYQISKLAVTRLADHIHAENYKLGIRSFAIHPGGIVTQMITDMKTKEKEPWGKEAAEMILPMLTDDISLPGNACVFLASGEADFMSGRYVDTTINFKNLFEEQDHVIRHNLFKVGISGQWRPSGGYSFL
jgi:NAD(P)-dependent dehydrogenase (short-subunit alcohol dehydrogenase family)